MVCAIVISLTTLAIPLCVREITKNLDLPSIYTMGGVMLGLVAIHAICHAFVDYQGHMMGALMERDLRNEPI